ncbi:xylulokinase [Lichenifustis flavocetrariae]|uniref:FGGY family carbohydrate kinase n=1 Tax=Lichenifustis flavocetrariae TaxID=2949735 RepID=A0AA42CN00_9HYPH|nr:FGGY family carbohydrate kinase [Lichenifustis flavocetrariae]MCW6508885.1 FGGY family carbohydrate kinase [Lichenifustis flavocetrariae]
MTQDFTLAIDVGTGSVRAALVDQTGMIVALAAKEQQQIVPAFGWAEQRPLDWWEGAIAAIRDVLTAVPEAARRIAAVCACGQMHGTVLIDDDGALTRPTAPLWNDKRTAGLVASFEAAHDAAATLRAAGNPATPAWPGFKLAWIRDNDPEAYARTKHVLMPKDYVNFRLTGALAWDPGDASCSFLMDPATQAWSSAMIAALGLDLAKLPPIRPCGEVLGSVTRKAAAEMGLREGTPVLVGGADYPMALFGSGACRPGLASDVTGTSCIITAIADKPLLDPEICNVATIEGRWGPFVLLETGGDAMRWARRAFFGNDVGYDHLTAEAAKANPGAEALFFLPYLAGERLGRHRNARAQFFGLGAAHGMPELQRALLEGVAFAAARHMRIMEQATGRRIERVIASGGGAKTPLWVKIKASVYGVPIVVPAEPECGLIGCAALAQTALGQHRSLPDAADALVRIAEVVEPDPAWAATYARMQPVFDKLYAHSQVFYDDLDDLIL